MRHALERVATYAPHLSGSALLEALEQTGWIDRSTAAQLLPHFRDFDPDRHFAQHLRRLSFGGNPVAEEFRVGIGRVVADLTGSTEETDLGSEPAIRFRQEEHEGIVLAYPEVNLTIGGGLRTAVAAAVEQMPDALVVVARNFQHGTAEQLAGLLAGTEVPGTLVTVNLMLGLRATVLRFQPAPHRVLALLGLGRPLHTKDLARLGERQIEN